MIHETARWAIICKVSGVVNPVGSRDDFRLPSTKYRRTAAFSWNSMTSNYNDSMNDWPANKDISFSRRCSPASLAFSRRFNIVVSFCHIARTWLWRAPLEKTHSQQGDCVIWHDRKKQSLIIRARWNGLTLCLKIIEEFVYFKITILVSFYSRRNEWSFCWGCILVVGSFSGSDFCRSLRFFENLDILRL